MSRFIMVHCVYTRQLFFWWRHLRYRYRYRYSCGW